MLKGHSWLSQNSGCNHSAGEEGRGDVEVRGGVEMGEVTKAWLGGSGETLQSSPPGIRASPPPSWSLFLLVGVGLPWRLH